ncbi:hypothetical protein L0668_05535 [Paraglaciecola aquimarina]|uniref:DUF1570 domain-containing protein n=1 Tax=Paraglaciecola algarum TaxID=3050085 RepID=A0ABS9D7C1_9ALTE|nr:hypothetical protein [Paraglaciecola sp. G1-23]MCF2947561.1 hypothetical protein [Paraglaciecola sp. G1-23]
MLMFIFLTFNLDGENIIEENSDIEAPDLVKLTPVQEIQESTKAKTKQGLPKKLLSPQGQFQVSQIHQCEIKVDAEVINNIRYTLSSFAQEMALQSSTHTLGNKLKVNVISANFKKATIDKWLEKVNIILSVYNELFDLKLTEALVIYLVILPDIESYHDVLASLSIDSSDSQGKYLSNSNFSFVAYRDEKQIGKTVAHELVHAINHALLGFHARWLNEGLAEYFKNIEYTKQDDVFEVSLDNYSRKKLPAPFSIADLVYAEQDWAPSKIDPTQRSRLYLSAKDHISYMVEFMDEANVVKQLMAEERKDRCSELSASEYLQIIEKDTLYFSETFDDWFSSKPEK